VWVGVSGTNEVTIKGHEKKERKMGEYRRTRTREDKRETKRETI